MKFTILNTVFSQTHRFFQRLSHAVSTTSSRITQTCHYYAKLFFSNKKKKSNGRKIKRFLLMTLLLCLIILLLFKSIFVVPVSDTAVILRLGKYERNASPGLHFRLPFLEKVYIVDTGNVHQETFGFLQVPIPDMMLKSNKKESEIIKKSDQNIKNNLLDKGHGLSYKGGLADELKGKQPLTRSYIRQKISGLYDRTIQKAKSRITFQHNTIKKIVRTGSSINGRIEIKSETNYITANLNIIRLRWVVHYTISNPKDYLFNSDDSTLNLKEISLSRMNKVIGQNYYRKIISASRKKIEDKVKDEIQSDINFLKLGLSIKDVIILDALPVPQVTPAFNEVNRASQEKENIIFKAQKKYLSAIPEAKGLAKKIISEANAKAFMIINKAQGEADQFNALFNEYKKAPEITKKRLYLETMEQLFKNIPSTIVDTDIDGMLPIFMNPTSSPQSMPSPILPSAALSQAKPKQTKEKKSALSKPQSSTNNKQRL